MQKIIFRGCLLLISLVAADVYAVNGDTLISVAPTARSMGGVGVAAPQDAISAIFANPAAMCLGPFCPGSQSVFAGTYYRSTTKATVTTPGGTISATSEMELFIIPAVGITAPISNKLRFGFGAYGISGMGVDYRGVDFLGPDTGINTNLQIMKFAPNLAYLVTPNLSIGTSMDIVYGAVDLGQGPSHNYTIGGQFGAIYRMGPVSLGVNYTTPEKVTYHRLADLDGDNKLDTVALESPQSVATGIAFMPNQSFLVEADVKWINWADAAGYKEFDWQNQFVYAVGAQYKHTSGLSLRAGYNYAKAPVKIHDDFDPAGFTNIQGKSVPNVSYEYIRMIGFPAIQEHHVTAGIGYKFTKTFELHLGYMHAFKHKITETSGPFSFTSEMTGDTFEFGLIWNYPRIMGW